MYDVIVVGARCAGAATSFGASPDGRTWVGLSAVISAGGRSASIGGAG